MLTGTVPIQAAIPVAKKLQAALITRIRTKNHSSVGYQKSIGFDDIAIISNDNEAEYFKEESSVGLEENSFMEIPSTLKSCSSPYKPVLQANDLSVLKIYFDICISNSTKEVSKARYLEHENYMTDQKQYDSLKRIPGVCQSIIELLESNEHEIKG
ncbi:hypothetical protein BD770DRAFT_441230 [Pilaira anomala]|nr:hypothetical protein BD770DRAFT_441230 [Pilaira anomala]